MFGRSFLNTAITLIFLAQPVLSPTLAASPRETYTLKLGATTNYGASPWYTEALLVGVNPMKLNFDTGSNFIWVTANLCNTDACNVHQKVDTQQLGFSWAAKSTAEHNFGPWGNMTTRNALIDFNKSRNAKSALAFFAAIEYSGNKFKYLSWSGGIGFPSESDHVAKGSGFYFASLLKTGAIKKPLFSVVTYRERGLGAFYLGGEAADQLIESSKILLPPKKGRINYLWGTALYSAKLGTQKLPSLTNTIFYLDTGSSQFKGDSIYVMPILQALYKLVDKNQQPIFEKIMTDGAWTGLTYARGGNPFMYRDILPDFTLTIGQSCREHKGMAAQISLNAEQYSYKIQKGEKQDQWIVAFTPLNGVGGLLVGSVFMDYFYTTFRYNVNSNNQLTQGDMTLYRKRDGRDPAALNCI